MKATKRMIALLVCLVMVFSLAACSTSESGSDNSTAEPADAYAKHLDINYASMYCMGLDDTFTMKTALEEKFNVSITIPDADLNADWDTFKLKVAAGELPDYVMMNQNINTVLDWYDQEVIRSIPISTIKEFAPAYSQVIDNDPNGWKIYATEGKDDEIMAMTGYMPAQFSYTFWGSYYRYDWLEEIGIEPNGNIEVIDPNYDYLYITDEGFTLDQMMEIFKKFKEEDPDGNGVDDTSGFVGYKSMFMHGWQNIAAAFGVVYGFNMEENGKTINYYSSEKYKEFLRLASTIYKEGYVDREWFTNEWTTVNEKYASTKYGYMPTVTTYLNPLDRESKSGMWARIPLITIVDNPDGKLILCPPEVGANGECYSGLYAVSPFRYQFVFNANCDDEKMERILAMMNYSMFDKDSSIYYRYGEEGVHYTMVDDGFGNTIRQADPELGKSGAPEGLVVFNSGMFSPLDGRDDISITPFAQKLNDFIYGDKWFSYSCGPFRLDLFNETGLAAANVEYSVNIDTIVKEFYANVIAGKTDLDAEWPAYLESLDKAGYQNILEELNKAPLYTDLFPNRKSVGQ